MNKHSEDYIPYESELIAEREAARERVKNIPDPRHEYDVSYTIHGNTIAEKVMAFNAKEAEEIIRQQCSLVGWFPTNLKISSVDNATAENS